MLLAKAASTSSWVLGLVFIALVIWASVWIVRRVVRSVRGIRHVPEQALAAEQPSPMQMSLEPRASNIVLPPPRRTRTEEEEQPPPSAEPPQPLNLWGRAQTLLLPRWLVLPLTALGGAFIVFVPLGIDRYQWGAMVVVAAAFGVWERRRTKRFRTFLLQRRKNSLVLWVRYGKSIDDSEPAPKLAPPDSQAPPGAQPHQ